MEWFCSDTIKRSKVEIVVRKIMYCGKGKDSTMEKDRINILSHLDCYQASVQLVCKSMNKNYWNMFANSWDFNYNYGRKKIMLTKSYNEYLDSFDFSYLGLSEIEILKSDNNLHTLKQYIDKYKMMVVCTSDGLDTFWHSYVIVGYLDNGLWFLDPYYNELNKTPLVEGSLENELKKATFYCFCENDCFDDLDISTLFKSIRSKEVEIKENIRAILKFGQDISQMNILSELFDYDDIYSCTIIRGLKVVTDGRFQMGYLIEQLRKKELRDDERIRNVCDLFYETGNLWSNVRNAVIRIFYNSKYFDRAKKKIELDISNIILKENTIFDIIKSYRAL